MSSTLRSVACMVLLSLWLWGALWAGAFEPTLYAVAVVLLGAMVASLAVSEISAAALCAGAMGALAHAALAPIGPSLAAGVGFAIIFAPRTLRARSMPGGAVVLALSVVGAAAGARVVWSYSTASEGVQLTALVVGTLLAAAPLLWPVDDPIAFALRSMAGRTSGTLQSRLLRGVALRRRGVAVHGSLSRPARKRVQRAWAALVRAGRGRLHTTHAGAKVLDRRIGAYLDSLQRATRAAARAHELTTDLDDAVLAELELERDDLVARADALREVH